MNAADIIAGKRDGRKLSRNEISFFVNSFLKGSVKDYQMSALLMAIFLKGMDFEETGILTEVMLKSGQIASFSGPDNLYVDKHSTGGVGDKVSVILAPLAAACGIKVPMLSGRSLGHTGGTLDKLESIPGFRTSLSIDEFIRGVDEIGCIISGQTPQMAPADRLLYALRDVTATVESIPLICSSILSKKFAAGPGGLVFDVKCGNGAFMKDIDAARRLAGNLLAVGQTMGKKVRALITDMNQPLGNSAGNVLEIIESLQALRGAWSQDLCELTMELGTEMLLLSGLSSNREEAGNLLQSKLDDGSAYRKFEEMVAYQRGDLSILLRPGKTPAAPSVVPHKALKDGYICGFRTAEIGRLIVDLGGGRKTKEDVIDPLVGFRFFKKVGDEINHGELLAEIHARDKDQAAMASKRLDDLIMVGPEKPARTLLVMDRLD